MLEAIRASGAAQVAEIEKKAYAQANRILAEARLEAEQVKATARAATVGPALRERARIIQQARLEAMQIIGDAREKMIDSALDRLHGRLASMRTDTAYNQVLRRLVQEALDELEHSLGEAGQCKLEADPRDREDMERILQEMGRDVPVAYRLKCWGGLIAKSVDGRVVVINTLEARLERATPYLRRYLAALLESEHHELDAEEIDTALLST